MLYIADGADFGGGGVHTVRRLHLAAAGLQFGGLIWFHWHPQVHILEPSAWLSLVPWHVKEWGAGSYPGSITPVGYGRRPNAGNSAKTQNAGIAYPPAHAREVGPGI